MIQSEFSSIQSKSVNQWYLYGVKATQLVGDVIKLDKVMIISRCNFTAMSMVIHWTDASSGNYAGASIRAWWEADSYIVE